MPVPPHARSGDDRWHLPLHQTSQVDVIDEGQSPCAVGGATELGHEGAPESDKVRICRLGRGDVRAERPGQSLAEFGMAKVGQVSEAGLRKHGVCRLNDQCAPRASLLGDELVEGREL